MKYETVIGLEVHAELATKTKIYCSCENSFGGDTNTRCCPVCIGLPGALPVLNRTVVDYGIKAGLAMHCRIASYCKQDRKNYFYPDLPKAYQISQFDLPLCEEGFVEIDTDAGMKNIGITRIHIEEDAGKLLHAEGANFSLVDYNRGGVPLIEIVSEPDMRSPEEAMAFLEAIKSTLQAIGVSDCKMQEGSLRCDINVSVRPEGQKEFGVRSECKNVNSFHAAVRAIRFERDRQIAILEAGGTVEQETRRWDDAKGESFLMRSKEEAQDYRYFPEPDLAPIYVDAAWVESLRETLPELPQEKKKRYVTDYGLPKYDAGLLGASLGLSKLFEETVAQGAAPKAASNWLLGEISKILNETMLDAEAIPFGGEALAELIAMIESGTISGTIAKQVLPEMFEGKKGAKQIVEEKGLSQISDEGAIVDMIKEVLAQNEAAVADFRAGKEKAIGFLTGQVMRASKGKANPGVIQTKLREALEALR
ncbi:MAG: Asp-tRNA(Asn)/Glu-tRNA(Gln) amidotransferase subunit GatB [Ruminococcaceae bacterium]|nr:Asp-tRNA(Asn)/Glu-tRNA(Gln) amidotransferase subunit GatB [Oscillospiraceae bacterium]